MYLNINPMGMKSMKEGLTLTWDVFKYQSEKEVMDLRVRLTLTWDVFKYVWQFYNIKGFYD